MRKEPVLVAIVIGVALSCLSGCGGVTVSDTCRQRINDCIRSCPANQVNRTSDRGFMEPTDTRSDCDRRCQGMCYP